MQGLCLNGFTVDSRTATLLPQALEVGSVSTTKENASDNRWIVHRPRTSGNITVSCIQHLVRVLEHGLWRRYALVTDHKHATEALFPSM